MRPLQKTLLMFCALCLATQAGTNLIKYFHELSDDTRFGGDFVGFWNAAHRVRHGDIAAIYDPDKWHNILSNTTGSVSLSWFVYPPFTLFGLWPLGDATYNEAVVAWSLVPLAFYFALIVLLAKRSGLGVDANPACENSWSRGQAYAVLVAFSLPFLSANLFSGQTGTLAVFFLGAAYFWPMRPVLAGICIGLLAIKPQMGLLMPFALLASGQWRIVAAAATTVLSLIVLSTIWLGAAIWTDYLRMSLLLSYFIGGGHGQVGQLALGPYVSLQGAAMPATLAGSFQAVVSLAVLITITQVFWRWKANGQDLQKQDLEKEDLEKEDGRLDLRLGLLAAGSLLATPYSWSYDTPLLMLSIIPLLARSWRDGWDGIELMSVTALLMSPYAQLLAVDWHVPFAFLALLLWFGVLYRRFLKERPIQPAVSVRGAVRGPAGSTDLPGMGLDAVP